jgi:hypothetical protein
MSSSFGNPDEYRPSTQRRKRRVFVWPEALSCNTTGKQFNVIPQANFLNLANNLSISKNEIK